MLALKKLILSQTGKKKIKVSTYYKVTRTVRIYPIVTQIQLTLLANLIVDEWHNLKSPKKVETFLSKRASANFCP